MRVEPGADAGVVAIDGAEDAARLEELLQRAGGAEAELEVLALREHRAQRRTAAALRRVEAEARARALRESLAEMKSAADWRKWSGLASMIAQAAQSAISAAASGGGGGGGGSGGGGGNGQAASAASGLVSIAGGTCQLVFNDRAGADDRRAAWLQAEGEQRLSEARAAEEWLRQIRADEGKLLERLEAYLRAEHEGRMAILGA